MRLFPLLAPVLLGLSAAGLSAQGVGDYPHMTLADETGQVVVPPAGGPYDNSNVFTATAGAVFQIRLDYQAVAQPSSNVPWALLLSALPTPFPTDLVPPPLFTLPPFELLFPFPATLDAGGQATLLVPVPSGLFGIEIYVQAILEDVTNVPHLQLSNGTRLLVEPPDFNAAISFVRAVPALGVPDLQGVGMVDVGGDTLKHQPPLGTMVPPTTEPDDIGLDPGFRFLPITPNVADAPVNPLAWPLTTVTAAATATDTTITVADTSFFPTRGRLYVATGADPFDEKTGGQATPPKLEVMDYDGKTATTFFGLRRKLLGSSGAATHPHVVGDVVLGEFTMATTAGALSRQRVGLDATNMDTPHVVLPPFTFVPEEGGQTTLDLDLYRYQVTATAEQGFLVLDRVTHTWRLIGGTTLTASDSRRWDPMVAVAPDRRSFLAVVRVNSGSLWFSDPDELWAIRLDGLQWPASGSEAWKIPFVLGPDPTPDDRTVRSRRVHMPSVAILGPDPDNFVAFVGLAHKFQQSTQGNNSFPNQGFEAFWEREEVVVRDYIDVPLVPPGSSKPPPTQPRPYITNQFPALGTGALVGRFDPLPLVAPDQQRMFVVGGSQETVEDVYRVREVGISASGAVTKAIANISGYGASGGVASTGAIRMFRTGGHGQGRKAALSPGGTRLALLRVQSEAQDLLNVMRTSGADFAQASNFTLSFTPGTEFNNNSVVTGLHWYDEDLLYFLMGRNPYGDPIVADTANNAPAYDVFSYRVSTNTITRITNTAPTPTAGNLGRIRPAGFFTGTGGQYLYIVRDSRLPRPTASQPAQTPVVNVLAIHMPTGGVFDVTGDEFGGATGVGNADLPDLECRSPVESAASMRWAEGWGANAGQMWFAAHRAAVATATDELFGFNRDFPFVSFQATSGTPAGAHVTNITPNPYSGSVAFARTFGADPYAAAQHPYVLDLDNFLFLRDLTPDAQVAGQPAGRVMDGSFHFIAPSGSAGDALVFAMGPDVMPDSMGIAERTQVVYYPLANVSNTLAEPVPLVVVLANVAGLGPGFRMYITSGGPSVVE